MSDLKGGNLARKVFPARMSVLLVSDVIGDPLDVIGSGPAAGDSTTFLQAKAYLQHYGVFDEMPEAIKDRIEDGCRDEIPDTPAPGDKIFKRVSHHIVANNKIALQAACKKAKSMGYSVKVLTDCLSGEASEVGKSIAEDAKRILGDSHKNTRLNACYMVAKQQSECWEMVWAAGVRNSLFLSPLKFVAIKTSVFSLLAPMGKMAHASRRCDRKRKNRKNGAKSRA